MSDKLNLLAAAGLVRTKKASPVELTRACLRRIEQLNPKLNAFITITAEHALKQAQAAESEIHRGHWRGPLHGIPISLKDIFDTAGVRTTAASALFENRVPREDAAVVARLKDAGAVFLGKTNLHEFAYGGSTMISHFGAVRNPWAPEHIAGGSSSGSATAVASGMCYAALGSDTAGSIRQPSAFCGVVGLKPTYGRVSMRGMLPLAWSYDHAGPITNRVADAAAMLQASAGYDPNDITSRDVPVPDYAAALDLDVRTLRLGIPRRHFFENLDSGVASCVDEAIELLVGFTAGPREVELPVHSDDPAKKAEAYAYHAELVAKNPQLYHPETLRRIQSGASIAAVDYIKARRELEQLRRDVEHVFAEVDAIVTPTVPVPPPTIEELTRERGNLREVEIATLRNTRPFNVLGLPTISVPCGFTNVGLPVGLQISAAPWREDVVLALAHAYEQATEWHKRSPQL
jgi:aspartyl-tRNA(Asn)/glutamyl-tRNA(Gln) amidotransferase subunit A